MENERPILLNKPAPFRRAFARAAIGFDAVIQTDRFDVTTKGRWNASGTGKPPSAQCVKSPASRKYIILAIGFTVSELSLSHIGSLSGGEAREGM